MPRCMTAPPLIPSVFDAVYIESDQFNEHFRWVELRILGLRSELELLDHADEEESTAIRSAYLHDELEKWDDELDKFLDAKGFDTNQDQDAEESFLEGDSFASLGVDSGEEADEEEEEEEEKDDAEKGKEQEEGEAGVERVQLEGEKEAVGLGGDESKDEPLNPVPQYSPRTPKSRKQQYEDKGRHSGGANATRETLATDVQNILQIKSNSPGAQKAAQKSPKRSRPERVSREKDENDSPLKGRESRKRENPTL